MPTIDTVFTGIVQEIRPAWRKGVIQLPPTAADDLVEETRYANPPSFIHNEDQRQTNSCSGHGGSTACEAVLRDGIQLSRWGLYILAQKRCQLLGKDVGATLTGVHDALKMDGIPEESIWPFTGSYDARIPAGAMENAALRKMTHSIDVETGGYDSVRLVIGQNIGGVVMACRFPLATTTSGIGYKDVTTYSPQGNGGHCMSFVAMSARLDGTGRPWIWCSNSHNGNEWLHWSPKAVDDCVRRREWGSFGITMMTNPKPRKPEWSGRDNPFVK